MWNKLIIHYVHYYSQGFFPHPHGAVIDTFTIYAKDAWVKARGEVKKRENRLRSQVSVLIALVPSPDKWHPVQTLCQMKDVDSSAVPASL